MARSLELAEDDLAPASPAACLCTTFACSVWQTDCQHSAGWMAVWRDSDQAALVTFASFGFHFDFEWFAGSRTSATGLLQVAAAAVKETGTW